MPEPGGAPRSDIDPIATLLDVDAGRFRYSIWQNLTISVWAQQATLDAAQRVQALSKRVIREYPGGHSSVVFILNGAPAPSPEASAIFREMYNPANSDLACMAVVLEGEGFWASGMRSMILNLRMSSTGALKIRIGDCIDDVLSWLRELHAEKTHVDFDPVHLRRVLYETRALGVVGEPSLT